MGINGNKLENCKTTDQPRIGNINVVVVINVVSRNKILMAIIMLSLCDQALVIVYTKTPQNNHMR